MQERNYLPQLVFLSPNSFQLVYRSCKKCDEAERLDNVGWWVNEWDAQLGLCLWVPQASQLVKSTCNAGEPGLIPGLERSQEVTALPTPVF